MSEELSKISWYVRTVHKFSITPKARSCQTRKRPSTLLGMSAGESIEHSPVTQAGEKPLNLLYSSNHQDMTLEPALISGPGMSRSGPTQSFSACAQHTASQSPMPGSHQTKVISEPFGNLYVWHRKSVSSCCVGHGCCSQSQLLCCAMLRTLRWRRGAALLMIGTS